MFLYFRWNRLLLFSISTPVALSRIILPVDLLFIVVVVSLPMISALVTVEELVAKSTTIVVSLISLIPCTRHHTTILIVAGNSPGLPFAGGRIRKDLE